MLLIDTPQGADHAHAALRAAFPDGACFFKSKPHYLEIAPEHVDKGRALAFIADYYGLAPDEVMAFGDGQNDVPMFAFAGEGYAMANGCAEARMQAAHIAPPNTEDGVAAVIEAHLRDGKIGALRRNEEKS